MNQLNKIQNSLKVPKSNRNSFGNYNYRSCEDILEAVKPLLGDATLIINDEIVLIGDRFYIKATASLYDGLVISTAVAFAREPLEKKGMDTAQITGATSSYARKYALNGLFLIDDTKDADATNTHDKEPKQGKPEYPKNDNLNAFMKDLIPTDEEVISWIEKLESAKDLKELKKFAETVPPLVKEAIGKIKFEEIKSKLK